MSEPRRIEYDLGYDRYQRRSRLIAERDAAGQVTWQIVSEPVSQRDDGETIRSLTTAQLIEAGGIAERLFKASPYWAEARG